MVTTVPHLYLGPSAKEAARQRAQVLLEASLERHVDLRELAPEGEAQIGIDDVREALLWSRYGPAQGRWKVVLVGPAERLSREATSALLKSLEEAPPYLAFLLYAGGPEHLPDTIRSRCVSSWTLPAWSAKLDQSAWGEEERDLVEGLLGLCDERVTDLLVHETSPLARWRAVFSELADCSVEELACGWREAASDPLRARAVVWAAAGKLSASPVEDLLRLAKEVAAGGKASCQCFLYHLLSYIRGQETDSRDPSWARKVSLAWGELQANANAQLLLEVVLLWPRRR